MKIKDVADQLIVKLYTKPECTICVPVKFTIMRVQSNIPFTYQEININESKEFQSLYGEHIPVVTLNDVEVSRHRLHGRDLHQAVLNEKYRLNGLALSQDQSL
mmetsp:Transcript_585/g.980  ORF Transcript_585/g.980 Transcript_585/m.980 type:complete len:103 (+) Transcript_585:60-368(+)